MLYLVEVLRTKAHEEPETMYRKFVDEDRAEDFADLWEGICKDDREAGKIDGYSIIVFQSKY